MRRCMLSILSSLVLVLLCQGVPSDSRGTELGSEPPPRKEKMRERIRMLRTWRLIDDLNLTEEQSAKFFPIMNKFDDRREELELRKRQIIDELIDVLKSEKPSEKKLQQKLADLRKTEQELWESRQSFVDKAAKVLSVKQQAKLLLFEEKFQRQLGAIIRDIKDRRGDVQMKLLEEVERLQRKIEQLRFPPERMKRLHERMERLRREIESGL